METLGPVQEGAVGLPIRLVILDNGYLYDPTGDQLQLVIERDGPDYTRETVIKTAADGVGVGETSGRMDGEDGTPRPCLEYVTTEGDIVAGLMLLQGRIVRGGSVIIPTEIVELPVKKSLS